VASLMPELTAPNPGPIFRKDRHPTGLFPTRSLISTSAGSTATHPGSLRSGVPFRNISIHLCTAARQMRNFGTGSGAHQHRVARSEMTMWMTFKR
jgi:hypothetical protein